MNECNVFHMPELNDSEQPGIYDLISDYPVRYTKMLLFGRAVTEDFLHTREMIKHLRAEFEKGNFKSTVESEKLIDQLTQSII
jgi:hypothetical protein